MTGRTSARIGAHVDQRDPVGEALARGADLAQFFLGDPQGWQATTNNRIRIPSRKLLAQHAQAAADIGAKGLIVHGGQLARDEDPAVGYDNWCKTFERMQPPLPILLDEQPRHMSRPRGR